MKSTASSAKFFRTYALVMKSSMAAASSFWVWPKVGRRGNVRIPGARCYLACNVIRRTVEAADLRGGEGRRGEVPPEEQGAGEAVRPRADPPADGPGELR